MRQFIIPTLSFEVWHNCDSFAPDLSRLLRGIENGIHYTLVSTPSTFRTPPIFHWKEPQRPFSGVAFAQSNYFLNLWAYIMNSYFFFLNFIQTTAAIDWFKFHIARSPLWKIFVGDSVSFQDDLRTFKEVRKSQRKLGNRRWKVAPTLFDTKFIIEWAEIILQL